MKQGPAAVVALDAAQIDADLALQREVIGFAQVVTQEDVFGRNGRVGFEFEHPVPIGALALEQGLGGQIDRAVYPQDRVGDHQCGGVIHAASLP